MWIENMDFRVICICVLCLNVVQMEGQQIVMDSPMSIPNDNVDYRQPICFYPLYLRTKLTTQFLDLLKIINNPQFSPPSRQIKHQLEKLVLSNQLEVDKIMNYANSFKGISNIDRMIVALFSLRDTLPKSCKMRKDLRKLILNSIFNKDIIHHPYEQICQEAMLLNQNEHCRNLCQSLQLLSNTCSRQHLKVLVPQQRNFVHSNFFNMPLQNMENISYRIESENATNVYLSKKISQLIDLLPTPKQEEEKEKYKTIRKLFESQEISEYLLSLNHSEINRQIMLRNVLEYSTGVNISESIRGAIDYYLNYDKNTQESLRNKYDFVSLIRYLPEPENEDEEINYNTAVSFLKSSEIYEFFKSTDVQLNKDRQSLYETVIQLLSESKKLDEKILKAFKFYADYEEYEDLELSTTKTILKKFRILRMFKTVINEELLDKSTLEKFKILFRFISKSARILVDFQIPLQVHTRAELIMAILEYFLSHPDVPSDIKTIIQVLNQHVVYTGDGSVLI